MGILDEKEAFEAGRHDRRVSAHHGSVRDGYSAEGSSGHSFRVTSTGLPSPLPIFWA